MKLYIMRHGRTDWNILQRLQGRTNIPLNEEGRSAAKKAGEAMKHVPIHGVITSPLDRALETAQIIMRLPHKTPEEALQLARGTDKPGVKDLSHVYGMPFFADERIMEMSFGIYEGLSGLNPDYRLEDPDFINFTEHPEIYRAPEGAESCWEVVRRAENFLSHLAEQAAFDNAAGIEKSYLISTHGAVTRALLTVIEHKSVANFWKDGVPANCAVSIAESFGEPWRLIEKDKIYYENS